MDLGAVEPRYVVESVAEAAQDQILAPVRIDPKIMVLGRQREGALRAVRAAALTGGGRRLRAVRSPEPETEAA